MVHREQEEINVNLQNISLHLKSIEFGYIRNPTRSQLDSLKFLYELKSNKVLNTQCFNCIKEGFKYVRENYSWD